MVIVNAEKPEFEVGYFGWLKLESLYSQHNDIVQQTYSSLVHYSKEQGDFLNRVGIPHEFLDTIPGRTIGFRLDGNAQNRPMYKFKKEILQRILSHFGMNL